VKAYNDQKQIHDSVCALKDNIMFLTAL